MSATLCVAVGTNYQKIGAWVWDGASWTELDPGLPQSDPMVVSCTSETFCLLVDFDGGTARFDGTHWTTLASRPGGGTTTSLSCATNTFCVALFNNAAVVNDGTRWGSPTTLAITDAIMTLSCTSSSFCLAGTDGGYELLYDGTGWSHEFDLDPRQLDFPYLSCVAPSFCMVLGSSGFQTGS